MEQGEGQESKVFAGGDIMQIAYGHRTPRCRKCKQHEIALDTLEAAAASGRIDCPCGAVVEVRAADDVARSLVPTARYVVNETSEAIADHVMFFVVDYDAATRQRARWLASDDAKEKAAKRTDLPIELVRELAADRDDDVREALAQNPATPAEVLATLAGDRRDDVRESVANNPAVPLEVLAKLAVDTDDDVRALVASHPRAPAEVLVTLARDKSYRVRRALAGRADAPVAALVVLAQDTDNDVLMALHGNASITAEVIESAALAENYWCRRFASRNPLLSEASVRRLCTDDDTETRETAKARLAAIEAALPKFVPAPPVAEVEAAPSPSPPPAPVPVPARSRRGVVIAVAVVVVAAVAVAIVLGTRQHDPPAKGVIPVPAEHP